MTESTSQETSTAYLLSIYEAVKQKALSTVISDKSLLLLRLLSFGEA